MKAFLEEYGLIIVAVLVILAFVVFATVFGNAIGDKITQVINNLFDETSTTTAALLLG